MDRYTPVSRPRMLQRIPQRFRWYATPNLASVEESLGHPTAERDEWVCFVIMMEAMKFKRRLRLFKLQETRLFMERMERLSLDEQLLYVREHHIPLSYDPDQDLLRDETVGGPFEQFIKYREVMPHHRGDMMELVDKTQAFARLQGEGVHTALVYLLGAYHYGVLFPEMLELAIRDAPDAKEIPPLFEYPKELFQWPGPVNLRILPLHHQPPCIIAAHSKMKHSPPLAIRQAEVFLLFYSALVQKHPEALTRHWDDFLDDHPRELDIENCAPFLHSSHKVKCGEAQTCGLCPFGELTEDGKLLDLATVFRASGCVMPEKEANDYHKSLARVEPEKEKTPHFLCGLYRRQMARKKGERLDHPFYQVYAPGEYGKEFLSFMRHTSK